MNGPIDVCNAITGLLGAQLDGRIAALGSSIGAASYTAAAGVRVKPVAVQPVALIHLLTQAQIDAYPCVEIDPGPAGQMTLEESVDGVFQWRLRYTPALFCWVRGDDFDDTTARALAFATAVKSTVLSDATLGTTTDDGYACQLVPASYKESSTLVRTAGNNARSIQGRRLEFSVDVFEEAPPTTPGAWTIPPELVPPHTLEVDVEPLHPALAEVH